MGQDALAGRKGAFANLAREFKGDDKDPVRVHYLVLDGSSAKRQKMLGTLSKLIQSVEAGSEIAVVLWRPKRKRFERFQGDIYNVQEVVSFVRSVIDSGRMLA